MRHHKIFVKNPADEVELYKLLKEKAKEGIWGFSRVYTRQEMAMEGMDGSCAFVLETDNKSAFESDWNGPYCKPFSSVKGSHGFHPDKGPKPPLLVKGPGFQSGVKLEMAHLTNGAPTWAKLLGVSLPDTDGYPIDRLLKKEEEKTC